MSCATAPPKALRPLFVSHVPALLPYKLGAIIQEKLIERRSLARVALRRENVIWRPDAPPTNVSPELFKTWEVATNDVLVLLQHKPVYTLGRRDDDAAVGAAKSAPDIDIIPTRRGGLLTYHGPGQLVGYPILDLGAMNMSTRCYVSKIQTILRGALAHPSIDVHTVDSPSDEARYTGVWCDERHKIASLGVQVQHRITSHGFALNIRRTALRGFENIVACGLPDVQLTCIEEQLEQNGKRMELSDCEVANIVASQFASTLQRTIQPADSLLQYESSIAKDGSKIISRVTIDNEPFEWS